jgi:hypothetical protein
MFKCLLLRNYKYDYLQIIIPGQFGFNCPSVSEKKRFETFFPYGPMLN